MPSSAQPSHEPNDVCEEWHTVRYGIWPLSLFIYLFSLPAIVVNIVLSLVFLYRGDGHSIVVIVGCALMIAVTPLMSLLIRRTMYWQISKLGMRYVNVFHLTTLTWDQTECVRRLRPFPIYFAGPAKRTFIPKEIVIARWLMESFSEFQRLVNHHAPKGHVLSAFASRPSDYQQTDLRTVKE